MAFWFELPKISDPSKGSQHGDTLSPLSESMLDCFMRYLIVAFGSSPFRSSR